MPSKMKNMFKQLSFRQKIILSQLIVFLIFIAGLFPIIEKTVKELVRDSLEESTWDLIDLIDDAKSENQMIERLKNQEYFVFYRISLINAEGRLIYDSHLKKLFGEETEHQPFEHPEVDEALREGSGYYIGPSKIFPGKFAYVARRFIFNGKTYVLRTSFPYGQIQDLITNFSLGFLLFYFFSFLVFNALIWMIFARLTRPIRQIIEAVRPYQMGQREDIPEIPLEQTSHSNDDFARLAQTLNSLSKRIRTQIQSISDERDEKEAILESLGEGVLAVDSDLNIQYINYIASKMIGLPRRQLLDKPFPNHSPKAPPSLLQKCKQLLSLCLDQKMVLTDSISFGEEKKIYIDLVAAPTAQKQGAILVMQDKSSHYKVLEMGKDFVANASHELRTPITIIKGFAETLHDLPEISKEMLSQITEKIMRNCERMEKLVKNLLTLADLENIPESRFRSVDLVALLENCRHFLLTLHPEIDVTIHKGKGAITIDADADVLELAMMNLLENAVKYSKPPARVEIFLSRIDEEEVKIEIQDYGIGIPATDVEHIFERFYTVDKAHSRRLGGAGLGLSIVKTIVDKHDGQISAESEEGKGTRFIIILPKYRRKRSTQR